MEQFGKGQIRIKNKRRMDGISQVAHQPAQQGALSGSYLSGNDNEALFFLDPIPQISVGFLINRIGVKETGIGGNAKG